MQSKNDLLDLQFIEARHKLIELGALLDRIDRQSGDADHRLTVMRQALPLLLSEQPGRAAAILETFSDHSTDLPESAPFQGATGAPLPS